MPIIKNIPTINVTNGTNGYIIDISDVEEYRISGTETLTTNWALVLRDRTGVGVGTPSKGMFVRFFFDADITLGGNTITILGTSMPDAYVTKESTIEAYYDGSNWIVKFFVDDDEDILCLITEALNSQGYAVDMATNGVSAFEILKDSSVVDSFTHQETSVNVNAIEIIEAEWDTEGRGIGNFNVNVRIARFHNIFGPEGT